MTDSAEESQEFSDGQSLQVGDSVVAYTYPPTEGLIIDRRVNDEGRLDLTLLIAPRKTKGKRWTKTMVVLRDAARLSKKPPGKFLFPIKGVDRLRVEAKRAKGDPVWVAAVKAALDKEFKQNEEASGDSEQEQKDGELESEDSDVPPKKESQKDSSVRKFQELEKRMGEIIQFKGVREIALKDRKKKIRKVKSYEESEFEEWRKWKNEKRRRKVKQSRKKWDKSSSSSDSSLSSTSSTSSDAEPLLGDLEEKVSSGIFTCPFHKSDSRGFKDVRCQMQGQAVARRHIRLALHSLYSEHTTLSSYADKFVTKAFASPTNRPFTMDAAWLQAYAENLDEILLNSLEGAWALWNEPVVDQLAIGFLELLVRVSPNKDYPVYLTDSVRRWMKKKRIGTNTKFGPVPYGMQHGKFTEGGVVMQQSSATRIKERSTSSLKQVSLSNNKSLSSPPQGGEKRPPPSA